MGKYELPGDQSLTTSKTNAYLSGPTMCLEHKDTGEFLQMLREHVR